MSVTMLPKYEIIPGEDPEITATKLHLKKNRPEPPDIDFPPYEYREFPCAMYREWGENDRYVQERQVALSKGLDLNNPREAMLIASFVPPCDSCLIHSESERRAKQEQGWADSPNGIKDAKRRAEMAFARQAAELNYEDRRLSPRAAAEKEALDDAADHHIVDVPETRRELEASGAITPKKRGRKPKHAQGVN